MSFTLITLLYLLLNFLIIKGHILRADFISSKLTAFLFSIKFIVVILFVSYFQNNQNYDLIGDHNSYWNDAIELRNVAKSSPSTYFKLLIGIDNTQETQQKYLADTKLWGNPYKTFNDCRTVIRIHSLLAFITWKEINIHLLFISLLSTWTILLIVQTFRTIVSNPKWLFITLSICLPSFWIYGNLIMKEHILFFGIAAFLWGIKSKNIFYFLTGLILLLTIKIYIFFAVLVSICIYFTIAKYKSKRVNYTILSLVIIGGFVFLFSSIGTKFTHLISNQQYAFSKVATQGIYLHDTLKNSRHYNYILPISDTIFLKSFDDNSLQLTKSVTAVKKSIPENQFIENSILEANQVLHIGMIVKKSSNSYIEPYYIDYDKFKLLKAIPRAISNCLFLPTIYSPGSNAKYPIILESTFVMGLFFISLLTALIKNRTQIKRPITVTLFIFVLVTAAIIGITTPVIGALVRYRIPTYIALVVISFILMSTWKTKSHLSQEQPQE